jgi:hypothetical protein
MPISQGNYILSGSFQNKKYTVNNQRLTTESTNYFTGSYVVSSDGMNMVSCVGTYPNFNLYYSNDYGVTWNLSNAPSNQQYATLCSPVNYPNVFYVGAINISNLLVRSSDGGATWTTVSTSIINTSGLAVSDDDSILYACDYDHGLYYSEDQGTTFNQITNSIYPYLYAKCSTNGSLFIGMKGQSSLFLYDLSTNSLNLNFAQSINGITSFSISSDASYIYATSLSSGGLWISNDKNTFSLLTNSFSSNKNLSVVCDSSGQNVQVIDNTNPSTWYVSSNYGSSFIVYSEKKMLPSFPSFNNNNLFVQYVANTSASYVTNLPCFREDSKILALIDNEEKYVAVQDLRKGTMVKTYLHDYVPIFMVGTKQIEHCPDNEEKQNCLFHLKPSSYPELLEDLFITGHHSILVNSLTEEQKQKTAEEDNTLYLTDDKFRLFSCLDPRAEIYQESGIFNIYHIALENENYFANYGVYANGLLVETCSKRYLLELSDMKSIN